MGAISVRMSLAAAGLLLVTGCGATTSAAPPASSSPASSSGASNVTLASGVRTVFEPGAEPINTLTVLASDGSGGAWTWLTSASAARLLHVRADGSSTQVPLGEDARVPTEQPGLAACQGTAWFGANRTVSRVSSDGKVTSISIPATTAIPAVDAHRPEELRGRSAITGVACSGETAVVTLSNAGQAFVVAPDGTVSSIALPSGAEATRPAIDPAGDIAIGLQDAANGSGPHQVLIRSAAGAISQVTVDDSSQLLTDGSGFAAGRTRFTATTTLAPYPAAPADARPGAAVLGDGRRAFATSEGVLIVDSQGKRATRRLGTQSLCDTTRSVPSPNPTDSATNSPTTRATSAAPTECPLQARTMVGSGDTLYVVSSAAVGPALLAVTA